MRPLASALYEGGSPKPGRFKELPLEVDPRAETILEEETGSPALSLSLIHPLCWAWSQPLLCDCFFPPSPIATTVHLCASEEAGQHQKALTRILQQHEEDKKKWAQKVRPSPSLFLLLC